MKENRAETQKFIKNSKEWIELYQQLQKGMNEVGDLYNWAGWLEKEMENVDLAIEMRKPAEPAQPR